MLIPLIVIGVLFLITWIVIGVSGTDANPNCCHHKYHDPVMGDPFHVCEVTELRRKNERLESSNYMLEKRLRSLEMQRRDWDFPTLNPEEVLKQLLEKDEPPKEITIKDATYKLKNRPKH